MTDRELLEYAAKAAGIQIVGPVENFIVQFDERHKGGFIVRNDRGGDSCWNPLGEDGDALRLAVKLGIFGNTALTFQFMEAKSFEETRRVIVRAAASIGKAMP